MHDPQDRLELHGMTRPPAAKADGDGASSSRRFLSVWYSCCHAYGRLERDASGTRYVGRCPRCGSRVQARIGTGGTNRRMFEAR
ncbi:MAG: hypothetical protein ACYTEV_00280 [Planctomycetota bacterium]|jgi:hypothetical protein